MNCRHLTKAGTPCKAALSNRNHIACKQHATPDDLLINAHIDAVWEEAYAAGTAHERNRIELEREWAERQAARAAEERATFRTHDGIGQLVMVGKYTYRWRGEPLEIGDTVELPEGLFPGTWKGEVTALGSSYVGPIKDIIRKRAAA